MQFRESVRVPCTVEPAAKAGHGGSGATVLNGFEKISIRGEIEQNPIVEGRSFLAFAAIAVTLSAGCGKQAFALRPRCP